MSTTLTGNASQVTTPLSRTITNASNASPIVITTSIAHLFATGDRVNVSGVSGNNAANGTWSITKLSSTTFSLDGSTGSGAYDILSTPTAKNLSLTPQIQVPLDDDDLDVASVNVAFEALADRTQWLASRAIEAPLADLTALAAVTKPFDGLVRHVVGFGFYVFKTTATTGLSPFRVAAGDGTTGGWVASHAHQTSLTRYVPCGRAIGVVSAATTPDVTAAFYPLTQSDARRDYGAALNVLRSSTHASNAWGFVLPIDEFLIDGSTLSSATLTWTPSAATSGTPTVLAQMDIVRVARSGPGGGSIGNATLLNTGFAIDSGGTYNSSTTRQLIYTPNRNNTIDLATYSYSVVIFDAHGTNQVAGNVFHSVALAMSSISDGRR